MIFTIRRKKNPEQSEWHSWFAWWPTRITDSHIAWLEWIDRRHVTDDEGTWAGGYIWHWEYRWGLDHGVWAAPKHYS